MKAVVSICIAVAIMVGAAAISTAAIPRPSDKVKNGWYKAKVTFKNPNTRKLERRMMQVMVESDRVVMIELGNNETVHAGYNNAGYDYRGGHLSFERDWSADIITAAETTVMLTMKTGAVYKLEIRIAP